MTFGGPTQPNFRVLSQLPPPASHDCGLEVLATMRGLRWALHVPCPLPVQHSKGAWRAVQLALELFDQCVKCTPSKDVTRPMA